ncbi:peptidylprolyl isomerase [Winogradskyella alexanderae]|uniref:Peptidyl-prolyl cis-trans isomerase n=1 Tax=Winogradskyella alexanderae TaxID=2877123 RepID=A0ABS7XRH5_9FLAO|nr:peptidylprolyl isomerase [Winogradskyella alexanderae]MCA0132627.1 peptidyl-prolyl cis-trans isomerase [Winogradskyella alexanderae]
MKQLFIAFLFVPIVLYGQNKYEIKLDSIVSPEDAKSFIKDNKELKGKVIVFNKEKHKTLLADDLFKLSRGGKKVVKSEYNNTYYKIVDKKAIPHNRVSYIFLDGNKMSFGEIISKRQNIIRLYKNGYRFEDLAKRYSMDRNASRGGDLGWFEDGKMHQKFEKAVKSHNTDDIFTVDIENKKWHYVILKTHEPKNIEEITVLRITEAKP